MRALPRHLREAVASVSVTIQQLVYAVALHASGLPEEPRRKPDNETHGGWSRNAPTPSDRELLRRYVYGARMVSDSIYAASRLAGANVTDADAREIYVDRCVIGAAAASGRTAAEIADFLSWDSVKRTLERIRYRARQ